MQILFDCKFQYSSNRYQFDKYMATCVNFIQARIQQFSSEGWGFDYSERYLQAKNNDGGGEVGASVFTIIKKLQQCCRNII